MNALDNLIANARKCRAWLGVRWRLFDIQRIRREPLHPELPRLLIAERELRP